MPLLVGDKRKGESKCRRGLRCSLRLGPRQPLRRLESGIEWQRLETDSWPFLPSARCSIRYDWQARAEAYGVVLEEERNERAREIMVPGLAHAHEHQWIV